MCRCLIALFWCQFDNIVDAEDGVGGLSGTFQRVDLGDHGLEHTRSAVVAVCSYEAQAAVFEVKSLGVVFTRSLRSRVQGPQLGDELSSVFGGVDCESLW